MANLLERIKEVVELECYTITELERAIGASKGTLSRALNNNSDIQAKWLVAIAEKFPCWSAEWLLRGTGEPLQNDGVNVSGTIVHDVNNNNGNTNIGTKNDDSVITALIAQLEEKDKQINQLLKLLSEK